MFLESIVIKQVKIVSFYQDTSILWIPNTLTQVLTYWIVRYQAIILLPLKHLKM